MILIVSGAIPKQLVKGLGHLKVREQVETIQTAALSRSAGVRIQVIILFSSCGIPNTKRYVLSVENCNTLEIY